MHIGTANANSYKMGNENIQHTSEEKDLGVTIDNKLKLQHHIGIQIKKANQKLGIIRRSFTYMDKDMLLTLYKGLVRPHLEYGSSVWSLIYKKEAIQIENVQRRATKLIPELRDLSYSNRLRTLGLPTLQYRRLRADIIETYKILNGIDIVDSDNLFPINTPRTHGHNQKIYKKHCRLNIRKYSFSQRVVDCWNTLPKEVVEARTVNTFKSRLNTHWKSHALEFEPECYGPQHIEMDRRGDA